MSARPILIAAGGTGGHVFPATALAKELVNRGQRLALATDARGGAFHELDERIDVHLVRAGSLAGGVGRKLRGAASLAVGLAQAVRLVRRMTPAAAVGFGGYASVPAMLAASRMRVPTLIHEQNGIMGRANRLLAPAAKMIALSLPHTNGLRAADRKKAHITGNPVREGIAAISRTGYARPQAGQPFNLLVIGGSQGARVFSDVVPAAMALLPGELRRRVAITQQCRAEDLERARAAFTACGMTPELAPFLADMPAHLTAAHLVVARAGASTVAELAAAGRPALLIPYPHATDNHQHANAKALEDAGGAWLIPEDEFSPRALATRIEDFLGAPESLAEAAAHARAAGHPDATARLADMVEELAGANGSAARRGARPLYGEAAA